MRGLTRADITRTGTAAALAAAAGLFLAGCGVGGEGVRTEGPAGSGTATPSAAAATPSLSAPTKVDAVAILKKDPKVSASIRRELKPCGRDEYPVDVSYGNLTGDRWPDVVVNVLTCGDAIGIGSYVYRRAEHAGGGAGSGAGGSGGRAGGVEKTADGRTYRNVFTNEQPPVYAEISKGDLQVTRQVYGPGDPVSFPSGEDVITYRWEGDRFTEHERTHSDYSKTVNGAEPSPGPEGS